MSNKRKILSTCLFLLLTSISYSSYAILSEIQLSWFSDCVLQNAPRVDQLGSSSYRAGIRKVIKISETQIDGEILPFAGNFNSRGEWLRGSMIFNKMNGDYYNFKLFVNQLAFECNVK